MACGRKCSPNPSPLPLPLPAMISSNVDHSLKHLFLFRFTVIAIAAFLCLIFILLFILTLLKRYKHNITRRRRTSSPVLFDINGGDSSFFDDDNENGASIMHPIWFINTVGLQQSIIDSIAMFKYRKEDNLVEGTECSVCLGEFQEDETLRMLPKCTHAFHVECIDTWLRSRKNCPLCRAPVIREDSVRHVQEFNGEARVDNLDDVGGDSFEVGGGESNTNELRVEDDDDDDDDEIVAIEEEEGCEVLDKDLGNNCEKMMRVNRSVSVHSYDPSSIFEVTSQEQYSYSLHSF